MTKKDSDELKYKRRLNLKSISNISGSYDGVGADLKAARERKDLKIDDVAKSIRISSVYIKAIEEGRFDDLPGEAYIVGFIKSYSKYLDLDQNTIFEQFKKESIRSQSLALEFPVTRYRENFPTKKIILSSLVIFIISYFVYIYFDDDGRKVVKNIEPIPQRIINESQNISSEKNKIFNSSEKNIQLGDRKLEILPEKNNKDKAESDNNLVLNNISEKKDIFENKTIQDKEVIIKEEDIANEKNKEIEDDIVIGENLSQTEESIEENIKFDEDVINDPVILETEAVTGDNDKIIDRNITKNITQGQVLKKVELSASNNYIIANEDIWVHINTIKGKIIFTGIIRKGNRFNIPDTEELILSTGNGGSLMLLIDGKEYPPLAGKGEILKNYPLNQEILDQ